MAATAEDCEVGSTVTEVAAFAIIAFERYGGGEDPPRPRKRLPTKTERARSRCGGPSPKFPLRACGQIQKGQIRRRKGGRRQPRRKGGESRIPGRMYRGGAGIHSGLPDLGRTRRKWTGYDAGWIRNRGLRRSPSETTEIPTTRGHIPRRRRPEGSSREPAAPTRKRWRNSQGAGLLPQF